ncbi:helix-turn-helix domain-containing protein [Actinoplanes sp. NPDC051494]|uniref:helix-turn-helix domain-containing protein n=1 Tax=Actinoplanes sp. NPDC051494 TaxID=3363907 RepID=UPI0037A1F667
MSTHTYPDLGLTFGDPKLSALLDAARDLATPADLKSLLAVLVRHARRMLGTAMAFVTVPDEAGQGMTVQVVDGFVADLDAGTTLRGQDFLGASALRNPGPRWISDSQRTPEAGPGNALAGLVCTEDLHALIAVRIGDDNDDFGKRPFGVLYLADRRIRTFTAHECALLASLADLAGAAIEKIQILDHTLDRLYGLENTTARTVADLISVRELRSTHYDFIDLVVRGGGPQSLVTEAARRLGGTVTLYAADTTVIATASTLATGEHPDGPPPVTGRSPVATGDRAWTVPVMAGDQRLATMDVRTREPLDAEDRQMLPLIAQAAAVLLQQGGGATDEHIRREFLSDLLTAAPGGAHRLARQAVRLELDLARPHMVATLRPEGVAPTRATAWAAARVHRVAGLAGVHEDDVVMLLPGTEDPAALARTISAEATAFLGCPVTAAVAGPGIGAAEIAETYAGAVRCLRAMKALDLTGRGASTEELGFLSLLLSGRQGVDSFVGSVIGPVADYDRRRLTDLVATLEGYYAADGSLSGAAESLHVHPNTVARRLDRVKELLGADWQRPARALEIQLALRLARLLEKPGALD